MTELKNKSPNELETPANAATKDNLTVTYQDRSIIISKSFLDKQDAWDNLDLIREAHTGRLMLIGLMEDVANEPSSENRSLSLKELAGFITEIDFELQGYWGLKRDSSMHRFWELPGCECPTLDNVDRYRFGFGVVAAGCPIHSS